MSIYRIVTDEQNSWLQDHVRRYLATDGADGYWADFTAVGGPARAPNLILTVTGRRSGEPRTFGLIYGDYGDGYVIVGSKCRSRSASSLPGRASRAAMNGRSSGR
jgi:hypothetical protein